MIIFLDIDGVLTTQGTLFKYGDADCVFYLNKLTNELDAKLVISSTWRFDPNHVKHLQDWGVTADIIGKTPHIVREINGIQTAASREQEILSWMAANPEIMENEDYMIIDDEGGLKIIPEKLLQTETDFGLTEAKYKEGIERFGKKE